MWDEEVAYAARIWEMPCRRRRVFSRAAVPPTLLEMFGGDRVEGRHVRMGMANGMEDGGRTGIVREAYKLLE